LQDAGVQFLDRRLLVPDRRLLALYRAVAVVRIRGTQMKAITDLERLAEIGGGADVLQVRVELLAAGGDLVDQDFPQLCSVAQLLGPLLQVLQRPGGAAVSPDGGIADCPAKRVSDRDVSVWSRVCRNLYRLCGERHKGVGRHPGPIRLRRGIAI